MARSRAADDFDVIRARLVELRRERAQAVQGATDETKPKRFNRPLDRLPTATRDEEEFKPFRERFSH
jgi:hypothetical protein